jgi:hypothetical protein
MTDREKRNPDWQGEPSQKNPPGRVEPGKAEVSRMRAEPNEMDSLPAELDSLERDGFVVLRHALGDPEVETIRRALEPHLERTPMGRNRFEGLRTQRVSI